MYFYSLRNKLMLLLVFVVSVPILFSGYFMIMNAEKALVEEKQNKLFGAAKILDSHLDGTFEDILKAHGVQNAAKETKIKVLNQELQPFTDQIAQAYPGIGVGYYIKDLDAQITYGPSSLYAEQIGRSIGSEHEGILVMQTGEPRVQVGNLMRGEIMDAMYPIIRNGAVIGYIYANELTSDIKVQTGKLMFHMFGIMVIGVLIALSGGLALIRKFASEIEKIENGLVTLKTDLTYHIPNPRGELKKITTAINDMAENLYLRSRTEEQVTRVERLSLVGEVAAGIAHEIRNPLMAIQGFAQLLKEDGSMKNRQEYVDIIEQETRRMDELIEQLLQISRPVQSKVGIVNIDQVWASVLLLVNPKAALEKVQIMTDFSPSLPRVSANGEQLRQIFLNLLLNAIQAINCETGKIGITINTSNDKRYVVTTVTDNGEGILPENLPKIFEPFFTTKAEGTGLGLSLAYRLIEEWGGKILVESDWGQGTSFRVYLLVSEDVKKRE